MSRWNQPAETGTAGSNGAGAIEDGDGESAPLLGTSGNGGGGRRDGKTGLPMLKPMRPSSSTVGGRILDGLGLGWVKRRVKAYSQGGDDLNIYSLGSVAIVMSYFSVGVILELLYTPIAYYLIDDLGEESGVYTVWYILVSLPWSFKVTLFVTPRSTQGAVVCCIRCSHR